MGVYIIIVVIGAAIVSGTVGLNSTQWRWRREMELRGRGRVPRAPDVGAVDVDLVLLLDHAALVTTVVWLAGEEFGFHEVAATVVNFDDVAHFWSFGGGGDWEGREMMF